MLELPDYFDLALPGQRELLLSPEFLDEAAGYLDLLAGLDALGLVSPERQPDLARVVLEFGDIKLNSGAEFGVHFAGLLHAGYLAFKFHIALTG